MNDWNATGLRLTDADRTRALKRLDRHQRDGRIDADEFVERGDAIRSARTYGDLATVFGDLEPDARDRAWAATGLTPGPGRYGGPWRRGPVPFPFPVLPLLIIGIVLAATGHVPWVAVIVVGVLLLAFAPRRRRWGRTRWAC